MRPIVQNATSPMTKKEQLKFIKQSQATSKRFARKCHELMVSAGDKPRVGVVIKCFCGKDFYVKPSRKNKAKFCSQKCKHLSEQNRHKLKCKNCGKDYERAVSQIAWRGTGYCSRKCQWESMKTLRQGKLNRAWVGNNISYTALHRWIRDRSGNPKECSICKKTGEKINGKWSIQWANISGRYNRNLKDYTGMCVKCHTTYDKNKN